MQQPHCLQLTLEPSLATAPWGKEWHWEYWETQSTSAPKAASFALMPSQPSVRLCLLLPFVCQQRLSPLVSDQLHPCLTSCLYACPARHPRATWKDNTPSMNGKKRRSLSRRLLHMESNDLHFGLGKKMHCISHMEDQEKAHILNGKVCS